MGEKEETVDTLWEEMKKIAVEHQQCFYENLPECTIYEPREHKYLQHNIGCAIYGPPTNRDATTNANTKEKIHCYWKSEIPDNVDDADIDITDMVEYSKEATELINTIYNKMCESDSSKPIYYGIIYNIIFRPKMKVNKKEAKKESKPSVKKDKEMEAEKETKEDLILISPIPIFTFRKSVPRKPDNAQNAYRTHMHTENVTAYETRYIDTSGRVYKSWTDYKENNTLPKCTMVFPKDGIYQPDPECPITEDYSTVWLEIQDSPACALKTAIFNVLDIASGVAGAGSIGLSVAAMFTPVAPVVLGAGLVATGASSIWTIGRCSSQLADRKTHEESISITNKEALGQWLTLVGTGVGLGAAGGTIALSAAAARGMTINDITIKMFNVVQRGNIVINGLGVVYQGYCVVDKYRRGESCKAEALNFVIHAMFFAGSVVKVQFANDIIENTQGKVINDYKSSLTKKRLRNKFNRVVRKAAENNTCKISENAEVLQYIKHRQQLATAGQPVSGNNKIKSSSSNIVWSIDQGKLKVNDIVLLDPIQFVIRLIKLGIFIPVNSKSNDSRSNSQCADDLVVDRLMQVLCELLKKFYMSENCPMNMPTVPDFEPLIKKMGSMKISENHFRKLFEIAELLLLRSRSKEDFLVKALAFVWQYCQANLKQWGINSLSRMQSDSGSNILQKIIVAVFEALDMMLTNLCPAFLMSIEANLFQ